MNSIPNMVIESLGVYLPPMSVTSGEVLAGCKRKILFPLEQITGIKSRRVAENEFSLDLSVKAVSDCLAQSNYRPDEIDLLICCNISRYDAPHSFSFEPSTAIRLSEKFKFSSALTFDVSNACAGMFTGIYLAETFLKTGSVRRAMVVSGEYITHLTQTAQEEMRGFLDPQLASLTLGDSAVAMIVELGNSPDTGFQDIELYTLGKYSRYCVADAALGPKGGAKMVTDSVKLSSVAITEATTHGIEMHLRGGWSPEDVDHFIMHQTSERTLKDAMDRVNRHYGKPICTKANTIFNLEERGNTSTTSHFVAFNDNALEGRIKPGDTVMFSINASGLTIGGARYVCDELPERLRNRTTGHRREKLNSLVDLPALTVHIESLGFCDQATALTNDTMTLSVAAAENCLTHSQHTSSEIDVLIYVGVYRTNHVCEPAIAAMIAGDLTMNDLRNCDNPGRTLCFDILAGAAGTLKGCSIASRLIQAGRAKRVMIVTSEVESDGLLGIEPSGSAMILEAGERGGGFSDFAFYDHPDHLNASTISCNLSTPGGKLHVHRNPQLESLYIEKLHAAACEYLAGLDIDKREIKFLLAPQISSKFLSTLGKSLGLLHCTVDATRPKKDLFTSSFPIAFQSVKESQTPQSGDLALCLTVASGIQVGCALYRF